MKFLEVRKEGHVWYLSLHRPPVNVIHLPLMDELLEVLSAARDSALLLVLSGSGPKAFSAGVDVEDHLGPNLQPMLEKFHRILRTLVEGPFISIARVHGYCLGGGLELALACDLPIIAENARLGQPEIRVGCYPPFALALYPLFSRRALGWILTGENISPQDLLEAGLAYRVVPEQKLDDAVKELVGRLTQLSPSVLRVTRGAYGRIVGQLLEPALREAERTYTEELAKLDDMTEGLRAFLEKRTPQWTGS